MKKEMICAIAGFAVATLTAATGGTPVVPVAGKMPATPNVTGKMPATPNVTGRMSVVPVRMLRKRARCSLQQLYLRLYCVRCCCSS